MPDPFVHLHVHTDYSLLDGAARVSDLTSAAAEMGMPALAITDHGSMAGAVEFYDACREVGIKPILGCEYYVAPRTRFDREQQDRALSHLVLLAKDATGYRNLCRLASAAGTEGFYYKPRIDRGLIEQNSEGLIALSACMKGVVAGHLLADDYANALAAAGWYAAVFPGRFWLEVQENGIEVQAKVNAGIRRIGRELGLPVVATNDVHYLGPQHADIQDVLLCIQTRKTLSDPDRWSFETRDLWLKDSESMRELFPRDEADATLAIAEQCNLQLDFSLRMPQVDVPEGFTAEEWLGRLARDGFWEKYPCAGDAQWGRLRHELEVISGKGFAGYFLIVRDFVHWARTHGILAQARGSAAGSIVAYCLGISNVEPLANDLLFERFLRMDGKKMPDIDVDFPDSRRQEVIDYVVRKYGADYVSQVSTINRLGARAALRDAGRVLGIPYGVVDQVAKSIPEPRGTIADAWANPLADQEPQVRRMIHVAGELEGLARNAGVHAAAVVMSPGPLRDFVPLTRTKEGLPATQYDYRAVERIGLLKMDFLGLTYLSAVEHALRMIVPDPDYTLGFIPGSDEDTYAMLRRGETDAVFQLESEGMRNLIRKLRPSEFRDLVALVALYRPGPLQSGMADDYVARKHGRAEVTCPHPLLETVLASTYGIIVYQEQVMQIAMALAGFDSIEAEGLLKGMGKKLAPVMAKYRPLFVAGAKERGVPEETANGIYDLMALFAGYGFNRSHATAYAMLAYQTAWLKCHFPAEYLAGVLNAHGTEPAKIMQYVREARRLGVEVVPPDVNRSGREFAVIEGRIVAGLNGVERVRGGGVEQIMAGREHGLYRSLLDFCARISDARKLNSAGIANLIACGAFDWTGQSRNALIDALDSTLAYAAKLRKKFTPAEIACIQLGEAATPARRTPRAPQTTNLP